MGVEPSVSVAFRGVDWRCLCQRLRHKSSLEGGSPPPSSGLSSVYLSSSLYAILESMINARSAAILGGKMCVFWSNIDANARMHVCQCAPARICPPKMRGVHALVRASSFQSGIHP